MKLGLSSYTYGWEVGLEGYAPAKPLSAFELIERTAAMGLSVVQIADNIDLAQFRNEELDAIRQFSAVKNIELEVGMRGLTPDRVAYYASIARRVNAKILRAVIDRADYRPDLHEVIDACRIVTPTLNDVILAVENHDRFPADSLKRLVESVNSPNLRICFDTANSLGAGEGCDAVLQALAPWVVNLHIKDVSIRRLPTQMGFLVEGCISGQGSIDIPNVLMSLRQHQQCKSVILEQWVPWDESLERTIARETAWAIESVRYLQPLVG